MGSKKDPSDEKDGMTKTDTMSAIPRTGPSGKPIQPQILMLVGPPANVGKTWALGVKSLTLGRFAESEIMVADQSISKFHAKFSLIDGMAFVTDLDSTNGTYINATKLISYKAFPLRHNDQIKMGKLIFKYIDRS
jgi:pSer/pThr/pTyr-binding forkhead associated (FHA) protein